MDYNNNLFRSHSKIMRINGFLRGLGIKPLYLALPILFAFGAAIFEGLGIGLLVPLAKGVIEMDFSFVRELPFFKTVLILFPKIFLYSNKPNASIFALLLGIIFTATVLKNIFSYFSYLISSYQSKRFSKNMREIIFSRYTEFGKLFFDKTNIGYLNIVLVQFTNDVGLSVMHLCILIGDIFRLIAYVSIMCVISWWLTGFVIVLFPSLYYLVNWIIKKIKTTSKDYTTSKITQAKKVFDILSCMTLVKSYTGEGKERKRFSKISEAVMRLGFSIDKKTLLINPIQEIGIVIIMLFMISAVAFMFARGHKGAISGFLVFFYTLRRCVPPLDNLNKYRGRMAELEGPMDNILDMLDDRDKFFVPEGSLEFNGLKDSIRFKGLNFSYLEGIPVLKNISFSVEKGRMTAIVGPTGSGKTTLINLILRFYDSPPSSIFIDGRDIRDFSLKSLRGAIALVSQDVLLFNDTLKHNIAYGLRERLSYEKLADAAKRAKLYDFIMNLPKKFDTVIGDRGVRLSGGEKQRLSIARALLKGSGILILDEATSSLDSKTERLIQEAIDEVIKNKTAIVIAHRLSTIKRADKIVVIEGGGLAEEGSLGELLKTKGKFYEYWEEQKFY